MCMQEDLCFRNSQMNYEELACVRPMGKLICQWSVCFAMVLKGLHVDRGVGGEGGGGWRRGI